ncbi:MAG: hypothetical protein ACI9MC_001430 [Kiritimatiellia bacterium]|jgi:hypothetical protein
MTISFALIPHNGRNPIFDHEMPRDRRQTVNIDNVKTSEMGPEKFGVNWLTTILDTIARPTNAPTSAKIASFVKTLASEIAFCSIEFLPVLIGP